MFLVAIWLKLFCPDKNTHCSHHTDSEYELVMFPPIPNILEETLPTHSQNLCGVSNEYFGLRRTVSIKFQPRTYLHYNTHFNINTTTLTDTCVISTLIKVHTFSPTSKTIHHQARAKQMRDDATMCRIELYLGIRISITLFLRFNVIYYSRIRKLSSSLSSLSLLSLFSSSLWFSSI